MSSSVLKESSDTSLISDSATVAAVIKMLYLSTYGIKGDFLYDSAELTIWSVSVQIKTERSLDILY